MITLNKFTFVSLLVLVLLLLTNSILAQNFSGAIFTSKNDGTTVNQNIYDFKSDVYLNGGPQNQNSAGLPNGTYYFQVTDPSGATLLSTDNAVCRQLQVINGRVSGATGPCPHPNGIFNPANGSTPVQLVPFNDTPNNGGEYKVWLIRQTTDTTIGANDPKIINFKNSDSKTDNFKVRDFCDVFPNDPSCIPPPPYVFLSGHKFYDANANSLFDSGEVPVAGIQIVITYTTPQGTFGPFSVFTDMNGDWTYGPIPSGANYTVYEVVPCVDANADMICDLDRYWVQTAPVADSSGFQGYTGIANRNVTGLDFGDICFGPASGGYTLGYWSNKNGEGVMTRGGPYSINPMTYPVWAAGDSGCPVEIAGMNCDLYFLRRLNLKETSTSPQYPNGQDFDPTAYRPFRTWLLNGNAVNMAYMLSVQLSATSLDVRHQFLSDNQLVDARSVCNNVGSCLGFETIGHIRRLANMSLNDYSITISGDPHRASQELMKNFLDGVNNNRLPFASPTPCSVFYPPPPTPLVKEASSKLTRK